MRNWIIGNFPKHNVYVEPFGGAASVLLNKPPVEHEVYNDIEYSMFNLMLVIRDNVDSLLSKLQILEYCKPTYLSFKLVYLSEAFHELSSLDQAVATYVTRRMSRGGLCGTFSRSDRISKSGINAEAHAWHSAIGELILVSERLKNVTITNDNAIGALQKYDSPNTVYYLDPPYLKETRVLLKAYKEEMTDEDHFKLSEIAKSLKGMVLISGYPSSFYSSWYAGWRCAVRKIPNHSSHESVKELKDECLWMNF